MRDRVEPGANCTRLGPICRVRRLRPLIVGRLNSEILGYSQVTGPQNYAEKIKSGNSWNQPSTGVAATTPAVTRHNPVLGIRPVMSSEQIRELLNSADRSLRS